MKARHLLTVEGDDCRILYDKFSHNEIDADDIVKKYIDYFEEESYTEIVIESIFKSLRRTIDNKYFISFDETSDSLDIYKICNEE
jgi:hypothetical protein